MEDNAARTALLAEGWEPEQGGMWEKVVDGWVYRVIEDTYGLWTLLNADDDLIVESAYDLDVVLRAVE